MKRFFSILILLTMLPVCSLAITYDEDSFLGLWVQNYKTGMTSRKIITILLEENHRAFYSVDYFDNTEPKDIERKVCSWSVSGNTLTLTEHGEEVKTLYRINTYQLSVDQAGSYQLFFDHVQNSAEGYKMAENATQIETIDMSPIGRWTSFFFPHAFDLSMEFIFYSEDYYFLENGSVYRTLAHLNNDSVLTLNKQTGIWIGDHNDMTMRIGDNTYKAHIDDDGTMIVQMDKDYSTILYRIKADRQIYQINDQ